METKISKPRRTIEEMFALIETWKGSGLSQQTFCKSHGLTYNVFHYWHKKLKSGSNEDKSVFEEIKTTRKFSADLEIIFPSGAKILLPSTCDAAFIKSLVM